MANSTVDYDIFNEVKEHADDLKNAYSKRDSEYEEYEKMYLLEWKENIKQDNVKLTLSPDPRNAVLGVVRLLTMTDPVFRIPKELSENIMVSDEIEKMVSKWWMESGKISSIPLHRDAVLSAALYGEVHISVSSTQDMLEYVKGKGGDSKRNKGIIARAERLAERTPFLFEILNPKQGYPEFDTFGLSAYYRKVSVNRARLLGQFGNLVAEIVEGMGNDETKDLSIWYDAQNYAVWVDDIPIIAEEHGLPDIPISVVLTDGSMIYEKPEHQRQPFLYGLKKSGFWERSNLVLTVLYTSLFNVGINPTFVHVAPPNKPDKEVVYDASKIGGVLNLEAGEQFSLLNTNGLLDSNTLEAFSLAGF